MSRSDFQVRRATPADSEVIGWHRARMFQDIGTVPDELFEPYRAQCVTRVRAVLESGEYIGWLASAPDDRQTIIAGGGVMLRRILPISIPDATGGKKIYDAPQALIMNVFTEPDWRRRGIARLLMEKILGWCREQKIESIVLHASDQGRALYAQLGFIKTNEMRLKN